MRASNARGGVAGSGPLSFLRGGVLQTPWMTGTWGLTRGDGEAASEGEAHDATRAADLIMIPAIVSPRRDVQE